MQELVNDGRGHGDGAEADEHTREGHLRQAELPAHFVCVVQNDLVLVAVEDVSMQQKFVVLIADRIDVVELNDEGVFHPVDKHFAPNHEQQHAAVLEGEVLQTRSPQHVQYNIKRHNLLYNRAKSERDTHMSCICK